jgi:hypothetical protein
MTYFPADPIFYLEDPSPFSLALSLAKKTIQTFTHKTVREKGIQNLHRFIRSALKENPHYSYLPLPQRKETVLEQESLLFLSAQGYALGIIHLYRFRSYRKRVLRFAFTCGEVDFSLILRFFQPLASVEDTVQLILTTIPRATPPFREYLLYFCSTFFQTPYYSEILSTLKRYYRREKVEQIRELYHQLFLSQRFSQEEE